MRHPEIAVVSYEADEDVQAKKRGPLETEILPFYLEKLDSIAKENNGHFALGKVRQIIEIYADAAFIIDRFSVDLGGLVFRCRPRLLELHGQARLDSQISQLEEGRRQRSRPRKHQEVDRQAPSHRIVKNFRFEQLRVRLEKHLLGFASNFTTKAH